MRFHPGLDLGLMTAASAPPPTPSTRTSRGSRVVHPDHIPGAAVVFVDDSAGGDAWTAEVEAVTRAGFCAVLLERPSPASVDHEDPQAYADDLAELLDRLEHATTSVVGRDHGAAGVVRFLASAPDALVDQAVLVGLVLPAGTETGDVAAAERLLAELHRIRIPVFVARGTDESQSVDDFATQLRALLPDRCMVRTYARRRSELTQPRHDAFLTDLLDFLGGSAPVRLPRVDLPNAGSTTDTTEQDS